MKKLASILALAFFTIATNAQSLIPIKYGIKVGLNFSNLNITSTIDGVQHGVQPTDNSSQSGISAGFIVHIPLSDQWFINPEVLYSQKGASFNYAFTHDYEINQRDEYKMNNQVTLSYVELNPTISYKATDKLALNFGPSVSFLIGVDTTLQALPLMQNNILTDGLVETASLDVGLNLGISYFFTEHFFVDSRVYTGFIEVASAIQPYEVITSIIPKPAYTLKNRAIVLSISYLF